MADTTVSLKGPMGGGGAEAEEEPTAGNNLSFPVIWAEGEVLLLPGTAEQFLFTTPYDRNGDGLITDIDKDGDYFLFAQKTADNAWQADSFLVETDESVFVTSVDWGDSLEATRPLRVGRPVRVELTFYKDLSIDLESEGEVALPDLLTAYPMTLLANPSSPDEVQGAGAKLFPISGTLPDDRVRTEELSEATVYTPDLTLVIQMVSGDAQEGDFVWNASTGQWDDADPTDSVTIADPIEGLTFGSELNVGGKVIYGLSQGGWAPSEEGIYRITTYLPEDGNTQLDFASILVPEEEGEVVVSAALADEGGSGGPPGGVPGTGVAVVDPENNLTYIDIAVLAGGGGGGGGKGPSLETTDDGRSVTVIGREGDGLWVELSVVGADAAWQNSLSILRNAGSSGTPEAVGALGSTPIAGEVGLLGGKRYVFMESGDVLGFVQSTGQLDPDIDPALEVSGEDPQISLGLDDGGGGGGSDQDFNDLRLNIRSVDFEPTPDYLISLPQVDARAGLLDLTRFGESGIRLNILSNSAQLNSLRFVQVDRDPITGALSVDGVAATAGQSFLDAVADNLTDFSFTFGGEGTNASTFWDPDQAGLYAPVLTTANGDLLTFGAFGASDGETHLKVLGQNSFGFEDLLANQGTDWDFNDFILTAQVV